MSPSDLSRLHELLVQFRVSFPLTDHLDPHVVAVLKAVRRRHARWRQEPKDVYPERH